MKLLIKRLLSMGIMIGGGFFILLVTLIPDYTEGQLLLFKVLGVIISTGGAIHWLVTVRCPHCGRLLDLRLNFETYCPYCGEPLDG